MRRLIYGLCPFDIRPTKEVRVTSSPAEGEFPERKPARFEPLNPGASSPALRAPSPPLGAEERDGERRFIGRGSVIQRFYQWISIEVVEVMMRTDDRALHVGGSPLDHSRTVQKGLQ